MNWLRRNKVQPPEPETSTSESTVSEGDSKRNRLKAKFNDKNRWYWKFAQQKLPGWAPVLTASSVVIYFFCVSVFCIALGVPILIASLDVEEVSVRYDNQGPFASLSRDQSSQQLYQQGGNGVALTVPVTIPKTMNPPVYMFFELQKFYQNHKRYVRSRSDNQMGGKGGGKGSASSSCSPQRYVNGSANGALPNDGQIDPCGLIAWSFFNDSYTASIVSSSGSPQPVAIDESNIAWTYDKDHLYGHFQPVNYNIFPEKRGGNTSDVPIDQNEHLMVWLRPASQPTFRKLWGRIDQTLAAGTVIQFDIQNRYDTYGWGGQKTIYLSTNSWVGGRNLFLGVIYIIVAGLAMITSLMFLVCYNFGIFGRRKFGDLSYLSWQRQQY